MVSPGIYDFVDQERVIFGQALGWACGVSCGYTSCILLPAVLRYSAPVNGARPAWVSGATGRTPAAVPSRE